MIPTGSIIRNSELQEVKQPSLTWKVDFEKGKVLGQIDGIEAIRQSAQEILRTERYKYLIYSFNYGNEFKTLIGRDTLLVSSELKRMIKEALLQDDRITAIQNINIDIAGDTAIASFTIIAELGSFDVEMEVL